MQARGHTARHEGDLVGKPYLYYLLYNLDPDYNELFKVKADFDSRMDRTAENVEKYAAFIAGLPRGGKPLPLDRTGVARVVEFGSRLADHQDKLTTRFSSIADLMREAHYWAKKDGASFIRGDTSNRQSTRRVFRVNRIEERLREATMEDVLIIEYDGRKSVGQVNGLAVLDMGDYSFGKPSRITARTFIGKAGVVNHRARDKDERQDPREGHLYHRQLSWQQVRRRKADQPFRIHHLRAALRHGRRRQRDLRRDVCPSLEHLGSPLKQSFAVTGSMDQNGDVQPIGGVNQKIEGFFDLCKAQGPRRKPRGDHPEAECKEPHAQAGVVDAVKEGKFSIYAIEQDGRRPRDPHRYAGGRDERGRHLSGGHVNYLVMKRLTEISEALEKKKEEGGTGPGLL